MPGPGPKKKMPGPKLSAGVLAPPGPGPKFPAGALAPAAPATPIASTSKLLAYLFLPSLSSESPTPASAEGASCADGTDGREIKSLLRFSSNSSMLTSGMFLFQIWCQKLSTVFLSEVMSNLSFKTRVLVQILSWARKKCSEGGD